MAKYIKKFETQAAYEAAQSGLILPNVSLTVDNNTVHYNPYVPYDPYNGHEYVDLGLPSGTKWATMNVGATTITDYGNYYQYGKGAAQYSATSGQSSYAGTEKPLATSADTAAQVWGGSWHMPTMAQLQELTANTTYEWTTVNGVSGGKFTAQNGNYVFFPAAGNWYNGSQRDVGSSGFYWSSTPSYEGEDGYARFLLFYNGGTRVDYTNYYYGLSVRGVVNE